MPSQGENQCITGTLFLLGCPSLIIVGTACDTWRTFVYDRARYRGGGGGNLGQRKSHQFLGMARGKS